MSMYRVEKKVVGCGEPHLDFQHSGGRSSLVLGQPGLLSKTLSQRGYTVQNSTHGILFLFVRKGSVCTCTQHVQRLNRQTRGGGL